MTFYISLTIILLIIALIILYLNSKIKESQKQVENLTKANKQLIVNNISLEANRLKFILQPHTLNNILAHLKVFSNKLNKGMDSLSETLEYVFYKGEEHFVTIEDEINFIKKYLALNDLFIHEINAIQITDNQVNKNSMYYNAQCVPHLITAYFLENAFKHGNISHPNFLNVFLFLQNNRFEMTVVNQIRSNRRQNKTGIGLKNMRKRLDLLMEGKYEIKNNWDENKYSSTLIIHF